MFAVTLRQWQRVYKLGKDELYRPSWWPYLSYEIDLCTVCVSHHRLTYLKGIHSFRYFPLTILLLLVHFAWELQLDTQCVHQKCTHWVPNCNSQAKCIYAWADNKRNRGEEVPEWVYAFWVYKSVKWWSFTDFSHSINLVYKYFFFRLPSKM